MQIYFLGRSDFNPINGLWRVPLLSLADALSMVPLSADTEWAKANAKQTYPCPLPLAQCAKNALRFAKNRIVVAAAAVATFEEQRKDGGGAASAAAAAPEPERLR